MDALKEVLDGLHRMLGRGTQTKGGKIGMEVLPTLERLIAALNEEPDGVIQQKAIEMLVVQHAARAGDRDTALYIIEHLAKHARQLTTQAFDEGFFKTIRRRGR